MRNLYIISASILMLVSVSCQKDPEPVPEHHLTAQELEKQQVADALDLFFEKLDPASITEPAAFIWDNSQISMALDGSIVYRLRKDNATLITASFLVKDKNWKVNAQLYGGIQIVGSSQSELEVRQGGEKKAVMGIEWMDNYPLIVLRYPDGTSYALSSFLVSDALLDFLLKYVLSTE